MPKEDGITRRDFVQGVLVASGGLAVAASSPMRALAHYAPGTTFPPDGSIGVDPRLLRGGNVRDAFVPSHWLRDGRLTWNANSVTVAPSNHDNVSGTFPVNTDNGSYDLIVVGGGLSGISTAFFMLQNKPNAKILILDANFHVGGNASRDDAAPNLPTHASAATAYIVYPYDTFLFDFYDGIGLEWAENIVTGNFRSLFFDSFMPDTSKAVWNGTTKWALDCFNDQGIEQMPFPQAIIQDFKRARQDFRGWYNTNGSPTDPPDNSHPKYDYLAHKSLRDYLLIDKGYHPAVADFYDTYASDCLSGTGAYANAYSSISFLGAEYFPLIAFPGGNSHMIRRALKHMIPASINGNGFNDILNNPINTAELDKATNRVRYRMGTTGLRVETGALNAKVKYFRNGQFFEATAKAVVLAGQMHSAHRMTEHLVTSSQLEAMSKYWTTPSTVANVVVRNSQFLVNAGMTYDYYWFSSGVWQDCVVADYVKRMNDPAQLNDGSRPNVLTVYDGFFGDPATERQHERIEQLTQPFSHYENALRADLGRAFGPSGFDFDRDVSAIYLYRWGHGLNVPYVGWTFGQPINGPGGQVIRTDGPRTIGRRQVGRISFGAQDSEGAPATEDAIYAGKRTAEEALPFM
jgi:spermidine dehydrogenase